MLRLLKVLLMAVIIVTSLYIFGCLVEAPALLLNITTIFQAFLSRLQAKNPTRQQQ